MRGLPDGPPDLSADAVMARAESRLGEDHFDFVFNNCEHFATWCKTGISGSDQVEALWRNVMNPAAFLHHRIASRMRWWIDGEGRR